MYMPIVGALLLAFLGGTGAAVQDRPDFSGRWVLVDRVAATGVTTPELEVRQETTERGVVLRVVRRDGQRERAYAYEIGRAGGSVSGVDSMGRPTHPSTWYSFTWGNRSLIIEQGQRAWLVKPEEYVKQTWSLNADGTLTIAVTDGQSAYVAVYRRRVSPIEGFVGGEQREVSYADQGRFRLRVRAGATWMLTAADSGFTPLTQSVSGSPGSQIEFRLWRTDAVVPDVEHFDRGCGCDSDLFVPIHRIVLRHG